MTSKRNDLEWLARRERAEEAKEVCKTGAEAMECFLKVSYPQWEGLWFPHWVFRLRRPGKHRQVLHYWPTKRNWKSTVDGSHGTVDDPVEIMGVLEKLIVSLGFYVTR